MDEPTTGSAPEDLSRWSLHCFCLGARRAPHAVVAEGDSGRLLYLALAGLRLDDLARHSIAADAARLGRLHRYHLIGRDGDVIRTAFPVIGPGTALPLRARMAAPASELLARIAPHIDRVRDGLQGAGLGHAVPAVVFGHILDGLLWDELRRLIDLPDTRLDADHPDWRGMFWAVWPGLPDAIGTNQIAAPSGRLTMVWNARNRAMLDGFRKASWARDLLDFAIGAAANPPRQAVAAGLVSRSGLPAFPVFGRGGMEAVEAAAEQAGAVAANFVAGNLPLFDSLHPLPPAQSRVIVLHELIWAAQSLFAADPAPGPRFPDALAAVIFVSP